MKLFLSALFIAMFSLAPNLVLAADNVVGVVLEVEGSGKITYPNGSSIDAVVNSEVHPQDVITTGPASKLYIQFIDNTEFTLSENAQFTVDEYNFNEKDSSKNYATYSVLQGAFLYVSGLVAKRADPDVRVNVPQASIGIRGTKFWGGTVDNEYGVIVGEGKVVVKNKAGSATLIKGQGTTLKDRVTKPGAPKKWSQDKIANAIATVKLQNTGVIGARMAEARTKQEELRAEHQAAQARVKREDPVKLEEKFEERVLKINPEMRPDLLEAKQKTEAALKAAADAKAEEKTDEKSTDTLRERLQEKREEASDPAKIIDRLNTKAPVKLDTPTTTIKERVIAPVTQPVTGVVAPALKPGTDATTTITRETTDRATNLGTRAVTTTTETTTTVRDTATGAVKDTTSTVNEVVKETPVIKDIAPEKTEEKKEGLISNTLNRVDGTVKNTTEKTGSTIKKILPKGLKE